MGVENPNADCATETILEETNVYRDISKDDYSKEKLHTFTDGMQVSRKPNKIIKFNVMRFIVMHSMGLYGLYLIFDAHPLTLFTNFIFFSMGHIGITCGVHRLWSHRSYKAGAPLRFLLACFNAVALQNSIYHWARDHRTHHKYSDTSADPHNANRGFFFSHIGWLMMHKHPDVLEKGLGVDMSDLKRDKIVMNQHRYYHLWGLIWCFVLPMGIPMYFWDETLSNSYYITMLRYILALNTTFLVNSAAHMWGMKPYDTRINPRENLFVTIFAYGEGFHNYHHTFPRDYATSEFGMKINLSTMFINFMYMIGQATDLIITPKDKVLARQQKTGSLAAAAIAS